MVVREYEYRIHSPREEWSLFSRIINEVSSKSGKTASLLMMTNSGIIFLSMRISFLGITKIQSVFLAISFSALKVHGKPWIF